MAVFPDPTPPVFAVFNLPPAQRLDALRKLLDAGMDPNIQDPRLNRFESVLGRACRPPYPLHGGEDAQVDLAIIRELLNRRANPLTAKVWSVEDGEMGSLFGRVVYDAWDKPPAEPQAIAPQVLLDEMLAACLRHGHRDDEGNDALVHMVLDLRHYSHKHYLNPVRQALAMGFDPNQSIKADCNAVRHLIRRHTTLDQSPNWMWEFVEAFIAGGVDMQQQDEHGQTGWDWVESSIDKASNEPAFQLIQSNRQARALDRRTTASLPSRAPRRV